MVESVRNRSKSILVSIVVCTHSLENYPNLVEAIDSLLAQSYKDTEIVVIVDANQELGNKVSTTYASKNNIRVIVTEQSLGLAQARNTGIRTAQGDIIAFFDDDAIADKEWVSKLLDSYQKFDAPAVGGKILPIWLSGKPDYLPEELYWLIGVTHKGFSEEKIAEVRDTFGPNTSFRREVFEKIGLFNENLGFAQKGTSYLQGEEAEFTLRMKNKLGKGVVYNPEAVVCHKVPASKLRLSLLLRRSFYQGYSKALLRKLHPHSEPLSAEKTYLGDLFLKYIPERTKNLLVKANRFTELKQLSVLLLSISAVGFGFIYGCARREELYLALRILII